MREESVEEEERRSRWVRVRVEVRNTVVASDLSTVRVLEKLWI
jgi:hypothetical protein